MFIGVKINMVAVNVDLSGLASLESVDWEVVALVRSGDVVVEVSEKWELASLVSGHTKVGASEGWLEICWVEIVHIGEIVCSFNAVIFSNKEDDVVQVVVAQSWKTCPVIAVILDARSKWKWVRRSDGQHLEIIVWNAKWKLQVANLVDHLLIPGDQLAATHRSIIVCIPAVKHIGILGLKKLSNQKRKKKQLVKTLDSADSL